MSPKVNGMLLTPFIYFNFFSAILKMIYNIICTFIVWKIILIYLQIWTNCQLFHLQIKRYSLCCLQKYWITGISDKPSFFYDKDISSTIELNVELNIYIPNRYMLISIGELQYDWLNSWRMTSALANSSVNEACNNSTTPRNAFWTK